MTETDEGDGASGRARARRYVTEFVVIFLGVSLSFFAENLREDRAERAFEREAIERLIADMESDLSDFPGNLKRAETGNTAIEWIHAAQDGEFPDRASLEQQLQEYLVCSGMNANSSEYESLKASGGLRWIRDSGFRRALAANYERYRYLSELHSLDCESMLLPIEHVADEIRIDPGFEVHVVGSVERILTDRRFLNGLTHVHGRRTAIAVRARARIRELEALKERAQEILGDL